MTDELSPSLVAGLTAVLQVTVKWSNLGDVFPGVNVSDRRDDWKENYRCPDVIAFLNETEAESFSTFWYGGPDFAIEISSPGDHTREKLDFYGKAGTRELLFIDRDPWALELFRLRDQVLVLSGKSTLEQPDELASNVVPLSWKLIPGEKRPQIEIAHSDGEQRWVVYLMFVVRHRRHDVNTLPDFIVAVGTGCLPFGDQVFFKQPVVDHRDHDNALR